MNKSSPNLFYKILKEIKDNEVSSIRITAKTLDITEELLKISIQSLLEKGYLSIIDDKEFFKEASFSCKFCPFVNECSERLPSIFYELSKKGKNTLVKKNEIKEMV